MNVPIFWVLSAVLVLSVHHHAFELASDAEGAHILRSSGSDSNFIQMLQNMMGQAANFMPPQIGRASQFPFAGQQIPIPQHNMMRPNQGQMFPQPQVFNGQLQQYPIPPPTHQMLMPQPPPQPQQDNDIDGSELLGGNSGQSLFGTEKCGEVRPTVTKYVAGGARMDNHEHPWYAQLVIHNSEYTESETYCGGTLISEQWVLTAAHCYDDMRRDRLAKSTHVIFRGLHGINRKFTAKADQVIIHPNYVPAMLPWEAEAQGLKPGPFNDLALVHLTVQNMPPVIRSRLVPVCVPAAHVSVPEGTVCKIMGHGFMNAEDEKRFRMPSELQAANVRISSNRACQDDVESRTIKEKINEKTTCVRGRIQPCVGDSGGPLVCTGSSRRHIDGGDHDADNLNDDRVLSDDFSPRKWYLIGVTSFAVSTDEHDHCGTFKSAVFGLVATQLDWIRNAITTSPYNVPDRKSVV